MVLKYNRMKAFVLVFYFFFVGMGSTSSEKLKCIKYEHFIVFFQCSDSDHFALQAAKLPTLYRTALNTFRLLKLNEVQDDQLDEVRSQAKQGNAKEQHVLTERQRSVARHRDKADLTQNESILDILSLRQEGSNDRETIADVIQRTTVFSDIGRHG